MSSSDVPTPDRKRRTAAIAVAVLIATFAAGVLAGMAADRILVHRKILRDRAQGRLPHSMAARLDRVLDLSPDQRRRVEDILERRHQRIMEKWNSVRPVVQTEMEAANAEIERVLTPAQREKFSRMKLRMGPRHRRGPGSGPRQGAGF